MLIIKLKKLLIPFLFLIFTICLVVFSSSNLAAAKSGLTLWATSVVPSLFPFFVATELLSQTSIPSILGKVFNIIMKPLFNVGGEGSFAFIMGLISGYPVGAKIACKFREDNILSKSECERLLAFTNNSGPLFIIGTVGISMFGDSTLGLLLLVTHVLASITVGILFRFWKLKDSSDKNLNLIGNNSHNTHSLVKSVSFHNLGDTIATSISNATSTIMMIGGFVVIFSVIISIFKASHMLNLLTYAFLPCFEFLHIPFNFIAPLFTGILEITNGIAQISNIYIKNISLNLIFTSFLLGIGGISVFLQVFSITSKTDLSIKPYIIGKILHGLLAAFYTFIFLC